MHDAHDLVGFPKVFIQSLVTNATTTRTAPVSFRSHCS